RRQPDDLGRHSLGTRLAGRQSEYRRAVPAGVRRDPRPGRDHRRLGLDQQVLAVRRDEGGGAVRQLRCTGRHQQRRPRTAVAHDDLIWPLLPGVLITKAAIIFLIFVWVRGTLPRFRYHQLMQFAWKRMLPVSLALVSLSALFASLSSLLGPIVRLAPGVR